MSDEDDIFDLFEFEEELAQDKETGVLRPTGRWLLINKTTGQPVGTPEASFEAAKAKARSLLAKRRPKPDESGGMGFGGGKI